MDQRVVEFLARDKATRIAVENHVRQLIATDGSPMHDTVGLLDPANVEERELLWNKSLQPNTGFHVVGSKARAISTLGRIAPDAAIAIGIESLLSDGRDVDEIARVLMQLAPQEAVPELCRALGVINDKVVCGAIGRAFREFASPHRVQEPILNLLEATNWKHRRAGAYISGFLAGYDDAGALNKAAYGDPRRDVCAEAQKAIRARQRESETVKLVATMGSCRSEELWGKIDSIIQLADPGILVLSTDPLGFVGALRTQPFVVRKYASEAINKRRKKVEDEQKSLHGKWLDGG